MKKIIGVAFAFVVAASALFAGPFSDLAKGIGSLDMSKSEPAVGKLPDGRDVLPVIFKYANDDSTPDKRVIDSYVKFTDMNPVDKEYSFVQGVVFKFGIALQKQESEVTVKQEGGGFSVVTLSMITVNVDKNGNETGKPVSNPTSTLNKNSKNIAGDIEKMAKALSDDEYKERFNQAVTSPFVLYGVAKKSALVFKKFIKDNEIIGRKISEKIIVTKVDEAPSSAKGYSYFVSGDTICGYKRETLLGAELLSPKYMTLYVYTNNDEAVSLTPTDIKDLIATGGKAGSKYTVNGTIADVTRTESSGVMFVTINVNE